MKYLINKIRGIKEFCQFVINYYDMLIGGITVIFAVMAIIYSLISTFANIFGFEKFAIHMALFVVNLITATVVLGTIFLILYFRWSFKQQDKDKLKSECSGEKQQESSELSA